VSFERRIFAAPGQRELVYFGGLVGGQPLPYRLDHNLSVGLKQSFRDSPDRSGSAHRFSDTRFWSRVWESFTHRRPLLGPKHFIRISIALPVDDRGQADRTLTEVLVQWLRPGSFEREVAIWRSSERTRL
jgi:hypothetical protein